MTKDNFAWWCRKASTNKGRDDIQNELMNQLEEKYRSKGNTVEIREYQRTTGETEETNTTITCYEPG